jgi:AcrR family transcriptional regulator
MGIVERKEREKIERRALIMRCAQELILEYGVERVSMMDIAKTAELSKATLYLYFSNKEDLFRAICDEAGDRFILYVRSRFFPGISGLEALKLYWRSYLDMYGDSEDMIIMFNIQRYLAPAFPFLHIEEAPGQAMVPPDAPGSFSNSSYIVYTMIRDMIAQGVSEGVFDPDIKPDIASQTLLMLFSSIVENASRMPKAVRKSRFIIDRMRDVFKIMLRGIAREGFDRSRLVLPEKKDGDSRE